MLAEQCNRFQEMVQFLEELLNSRTEDLNSDERNLLSIAYKNSISSERAALRTILAYQAKEAKKSSSNFITYIQEYRTQVENEFKEKKKKIIKTIDDKLIPLANETDAKVFYVKMKGDYNRYIAEYAEGDAKEQVKEAAKKAYEEATKYASELKVTDPIRLGLALNFSVFYYEVMSNHDEACKIAKEALDVAKKDLEDIDPEADESKDTVSIVNLLKENLGMWEEEGEEEQQ